MQEETFKYLTKNGAICIEKTQDGMTNIVFEVMQREEVDELTLNMIALGFDVLYEPRNKAEAYESCIVCGEKTYIKLLHMKEEN